LQSPRSRSATDQMKDERFCCDMEGESEGRGRGIWGQCSPTRLAKRPAPRTRSIPTQRPHRRPGGRTISLIRQFPAQCQLRSTSIAQPGNRPQSPKPTTTPGPGTLGINSCNQQCLSSRARELIPTQVHKALGQRVSVAPHAPRGRNRCRAVLKQKCQSYAGWFPDQRRDITFVQLDGQIVSMRFPSQRCPYPNPPE
jgi:hypothetical protein